MTKAQTARRAVAKRCPARKGRVPAAIANRALTLRTRLEGPTAEPDGFSREPFRGPIRHGIKPMFEDED